MGTIRDDVDDMWHELGLDCCSYNSKLAHDMLTVLRGIRDKKYCTDIAEENNLAPEYVELLQSILASKDITDYGTSPRGCWFCVDADEYIKKWERYYEAMWPQKAEDEDE